MRFWQIAALLLLIGFLVTGGLGYAFYKTFKYQGQDAVSQMTDEEKKWLEVVSSITQETTKEQIYEALGEPDQDIVLLVKWHNFGSSPLSQLRIYFFNGHPWKVRWIKLGYFYFETKLKKKEDKVLKIEI